MGDKIKCFYLFLILNIYIKHLISKINYNDDSILPVNTKQRRVFRQIFSVHCYCCCRC